MKKTGRDYTVQGKIPTKPQWGSDEDMAGRCQLTPTGLTPR